MRSDPVETARRFVDERFPEARVALVAGSVVRGEGTPTSDLDIVILTDRDEAPFRASYLFEGWPIEAFVHTEDSLRRFLADDAKRRRPSLHKMIEEGTVLRDEGDRAEGLRAESQALLERGPEQLTPEQIDDWRYGLTDLLDDFLGVSSFEEGIFMANDLAVQIANLTLLLHGHWLGSGKWVPRALKRYDPALAEELISALGAYYRREEKEPLIALAERALAPTGGRLFEGYYRAAPKTGDATP